MKNLWLSISEWIPGLLREFFPVRDRGAAWCNLKRNWYFPISALALFCLSADNARGYMAALLMAFAAVLVFTSQIPSVAQELAAGSRGEKLFYAAGALGIVLANQERFYNHVLKLALPAKFNVVFLAVSYVGAVAALCFVYILLRRFWRAVANIWREHGRNFHLSWAEIAVCALLWVACTGLTAYAFLQSEAFYAAEAIYTSDSGFLVQGNAYMVLTHNENDLRQPLFAVFSAPFAALPYLLGRLCWASAALRAILLNAAQILLLLVADLLLADLLGLGKDRRICFVLLLCCTYMTLLFTLMMEQYIVVYFWLMVFLWMAAGDKRPDRLALWGMGGTLITGLVFLPLMSEHSPRKRFGAWLGDMVKHGLELAALLLVFCRFNVILNLLQDLSALSRFTGRDLSFAEKMWQYTAFVRSVFAAPAAGPTAASTAPVSWQLHGMTGICITGVVIWLLAVISAVWNREKKSSRLAAFWVAFSAVMLLGLGWGTQENGLILYALYFGWAFFALLYQLAEKIGEVLKLRFLAPVCALAAAPALAAINFPALWEMLTFAITHYPV